MVANRTSRLPGGTLFPNFYPHSENNPMRTMRLLVCPALMAISLAASGCGGTAASADLVPVSGTILLDGKPLVGASVTFVGVGATPGEGATGITDETGKYELAHFRAGTGAMPGQYKVIISKRVMSDGTPIPTGTLSIAELSTRELLPWRFSDYHNAQLKASVAKGGSPVDFQVTSR